MFDIDVEAILNGSIAIITPLCCGICTHIHIIWSWRNTIWVWFWCGRHFEWVYSLNHLIIMWFAPWEVSRIQGKTLKAWPVRAAISNNMVRTHSHAHAHLHHMKVWNTSDVFDFEVEAKLNGTILNYYIIMWSDPQDSRGTTRIKSFQKLCQWEQL